MVYSMPMSNFSPLLFTFQDKWKPNITFVVGKKADDYAWINILGQTIAAGSRRLFSTFSKKELYNDVSLLTIFCFSMYQYK